MHLSVYVSKWDASCDVMKYGTVIATLVRNPPSNATARPGSTNLWPQYSIDSNNTIN